MSYDFEAIEKQALAKDYSFIPSNKSEQEVFFQLWSQYTKERYAKELAIVRPQLFVAKAIALGALLLIVAQLSIFFFVVSL